MTGGNNRNQGFTLIELISIILLVGVISVVATAKWPGDMKEEAAVKEFKRAIRYAQHQAMTREYVAGDAWSLVLSGTSYSIQRQLTTTDNVPDFTNRFLLDDAAIALSGPANLWFNALGEPIDNGGTPLGAAVSYTVAGTEFLTVCPQTGYVMEGGSCP
jgi:type II secretory pathway pseudopilin PulG